MEDVKFFAKYPFLNKSREYVKTKELTIESILKHPIYSRAIRIASERIEQGVNGKINFSPLLCENEELKKEWYECWLISYGISKILINIDELKIYKDSYANAETKLFNEFIEKEEESKRTQVLSEIIPYNINEKRIFVDFVDYLKYLRIIKNKENKEKFVNKKLVNKILVGGFVEVKEEELINIAKEIVNEKFKEEITVNIEELPKEILNIGKILRDKLKNIKKETKIFERKEFKGDLPPSMAFIIKKIKDNTATHNERFALATYLLNIGMKIEKIKEIFKQSPKYDEKKTEYYLNEIAKKGYKCYNYDKMKSLGMFVSEEEEKFKNPLAYRKQ